MSSILSLGFDYKGCHYSFLARVKEKAGITEYHVTIMNGELEKILFGNHIIVGVNGKILMDVPVEINEQSHLKFHIAKSLSEYFREQSLTSY